MFVNVVACQLLLWRLNAVSMSILSFLVHCICSFEEEEYSTHVVGFFFCIGF